MAAIWLTLLQRSAAVQPRPFLLEKPLPLYTDCELEHVVLKWQSSRAVCPPAQPKEREFLILPTDAYLVEGGRWILFGMGDGSVRYHDLNTPDKAVTLVPTAFGKGAHATTLLSVDMDQDALHLTFNLGVMSWVSTHDDDRHLSARWIEVHRVTSHWNEDGRVRGLQAEQLTSFPEQYMYDCKLFTLRGNHVVYSMDSSKPPINTVGQLITIVDWTLADSSSLVYPRRIIFRRHTQWLALLPEDRLLLHDGGQILLFDLNAVPKTTCLPPNQSHLPNRQRPVAALQFWVTSISLLSQSLSLYRNNGLLEL